MYSLLLFGRRASHAALVAMLIFVGVAAMAADEAFGTAGTDVPVHGIGEPPRQPAADEAGGPGQQGAHRAAVTPRQPGPSGCPA